MTGVRRGFRRALEAWGGSAPALVATGIAALGFVAAWSAALAHDTTPNAARVRVAVAVVFILGGLLAARRRPRNPAGALMVAVGLLGHLGLGLEETETPWIWTVGLVARDLEVPVLAYLLLSFPHGRLGGTWDRLLVVGFVLRYWAWKPFVVAWSAPAAACWTCPPAGNLLFVDPAPIDATLTNDVLDAAHTVLIALVLVTLVARWVRASPPARRILVPVLVAALALGLRLVFGRELDELLAPNTRHRFVGYFGDQVMAFGVPDALISVLMPVGFLLGLFQTRVTRSTVGQLVVDLGRQPESGPLRDLLARALGDPSLRIGFWAPALERYVDAEGHPFALPDPGEGAAVTYVAGDEGPLAALVHDAALREDPGLIDAVAGAARLALDNERLKAEVRAQLEVVSESRARIVAAGDDARRRIERDLHDGAQQRLVSLAVQLRLLRARMSAGAGEEELDALADQVGERLQTALEELRDLARGIHPSILTDQGLAAGLELLAAQAPLPVVIGDLPEGRLPTAVEAAAYYLCSEAITNAAKHAEASKITITTSSADGRLRILVEDDGHGGARIEGGGGLRGLVDRVEALGGRLRLVDPAAPGTRIEADLPLEA